MSTPSYPSGQSGRWYGADILALLRTEEEWTCLICRDGYGRITFWGYFSTNLWAVKAPFYQLYHIDCWMNSVQFISINRTSIPYTSINCSIEDPGARLADVHDAAARGERPRPTTIHDEITNEKDPKKGFNHWHWHWVVVSSTVSFFLDPQLLKTRCVLFFHTLPLRPWEIRIAPKRARTAILSFGGSNFILRISFSDDQRMGYHLHISWGYHLQFEIWIIFSNNGPPSENRKKLVA